MKKVLCLVLVVVLVAAVSVGCGGQNKLDPLNIVDSGIIGKSEESLAQDKELFKDSSTDLDGNPYVLYRKDTKFWGEDATVMYSIEEGKVDSISYMISKDKFRSSDDEYVDKFFEIKDALVQKYGEPYLEKVLYSFGDDFVSEDVVNKDDMKKQIDEVLEKGDFSSADFLWHDGKIRKIYLAFYNVTRNNYASISLSY